MLTEHPDVLRRLRAEILGRVGGVRRPAYEDLKEMNYLRAVINGASSYRCVWVVPQCVRI
jgi:hypothetical protein